MEGSTEKVFWEEVWSDRDRVLGLRLGGDKE